MKRSRRRNQKKTPVKRLKKTGGRPQRVNPVGSGLDPGQGHVPDGRHIQEKSPGPVALDQDQRGGVETGKAAHPAGDTDAADLETENTGDDPLETDIDTRKIDGEVEAGTDIVKGATGVGLDTAAGHRRTNTGLERAVVAAEIGDIILLRPLLNLRGRSI